MFRSDRLPALLLLVSAAAGLIVANSGWGDAAAAVKDAKIGIPGVLEMSVGHWVADGLLAVFFFVVAVELQYELTSGQLNSRRRAVRPAIAAAGGVIAPILVYVLISSGTPSVSGWPIPTATDIAFALGVLAVFGRGLPSGIRIFLLALAILDDIVGIVFIAVLFTDDVDLVLLGAAVILLVGFAWLSRAMTDRNRVAVSALLIVIAIAVWVLVYLSGVHATIAGVGLGLAMMQQPALRVRHVLEPWVNALVLPLFAFSSALVIIPQVSPAEISPAFWGVLVALPVGKLIGIAGAGWLGQRLLHEEGVVRLRMPDLIAAGSLGGIGFTVSLLLSELAFAGEGTLRDEATLGVLAGSGIAILMAAVLVSWRARHYRRLAEEAQT